MGLSMIDFSTITLVDYGVVLVLVISAIMATLRGMTREILGLAGWIISFFMANYSAPRLGGAINDTLNLGGFGDALGWGIPFAATVVISFIIFISKERHLTLEKHLINAKEYTSLYISN